MSGFDAIVLSGGGSSRLGRDKLRELVGERTLLARVTLAVDDAQRVIVVGDPSGASRCDIAVSEQPSGGGPVAAIAAGLAEVGADVVVVVAGDLPFLTPTAVDELCRALDEHGVDVAVAVDDEDREQPLLAAWRADRLRAAVDGVGLPDGAAMRAVLRGATTQVRVSLGGDPVPWWDCDTPEELAMARAWAAGGSTR